ncbi:MAG: pseudouridine synthase, partial [Planctomycetes bacterium]|nr:pseudouridine synthase [Planctomycetota bacterium]
AVTHVQPLESLGEYTLLECRLETGRTHQIRIHLAELGHPVCGDPVYRGPVGSAPVSDRSGAPRLALHAARLGFAHPANGPPLHCELPLPRDLHRFVERLRQPGS